MMQTITPVDTSAIDPQQQQWMIMQPPPQSQLQHPQLMAQLQVSSADENRTLWIGGLQHWMDETYLHYCFASAEGFLSLKIIRNKQTGQSKGYGFLEFVSHAAAQMALQNYSGLQMSNAEKICSLNWATFGVGEKRPEDYTIFVGDLASDVTDYLLQETFRAIFPSVKGAKVVTDRTTGRSKGYGFVMFGVENEQVRAMTEMNGIFCSSRPMQIGPATRKKNIDYQQPYPKLAASGSDNTTLFVGGLDTTVTVQMLTQTFVHFGELVQVKILMGKGCGFVRFRNRASADGALQMLQGRVLGKRPIRLSWALSPANKQVQAVGWVQTQQVSPADENRTLWIGGLHHWMDETYLCNCFPSTEDLISLKIIRNKQTGQSAGYGFLEFISHEAAQMSLQNYNGLQMPNAEEFYRLNWATFGVGEKRPKDYSIFVGDLASDVTDDLLQETFGSIYPSVKGAKVVTDSATGRSKGYGFVRFGDENEQVRAMTEMNGKFCFFRPMRIGPATRKKTTGYQQSYTSGGLSLR